MNKNKNKPKSQPVVKSAAAGIELVPVLQAPQRDGFDISKWRSAIKRAEDPDMPSRVLLYDIYNDILLDSHLTAITDKRLEKVMGTKLVFTNEGKPNEAINALIESPWFSDMLNDILSSRFWGYTASWIDLSGGMFHKYKLFNRRHIVPEKGLFLVKQEDRNGVDITVPPYSDYILTAGKPDNFGLLIKAASWVLLKRGDISDWATFNEIFAAPIRVGHYPDFNPEIKKEMAKAIGQSGAMPWYLIPEGAKLELIQNDSSGSTSAYKELADFCDKQLSKLFLHATMTLDAEGGQYKGDIHAESESIVHQSDRRYVLSVLNTKFKTLLETHGFNPGDGKFQFIVEDHICILERFDMDVQMNNIIEIPPEYFYEKYNIPLPESGPAPAKNKQSAEANLQPTVRKHRQDPDEPTTPEIRRKRKNFSDFFG